MRRQAGGSPEAWLRGRSQPQAQVSSANRGAISLHRFGGRMTGRDAQAWVGREKRGVTFWDCPGFAGLRVLAESFNN